MLAFVIQNHSHRAGADLGRELVGRLACHGSTFSGVGASDQPGAVQIAKTSTRCNAFASGFPSFALRISAVQQAVELSALRDACTDSERLSLIASITD